MITYKDQAFCDKSDKCKPLSECGRQIKPEDRVAADRIGLPFGLTDFSKSCGMFKEVKGK